MQEIIKQAIALQNKNIISSHKLTNENGALVFSVHQQKNKFLLIVAVILIVIGCYYIYQYYNQTGELSQQIWHWGLIGVGVIAIANRKRLATQKTVIDNKTKTIKYLKDGKVVNQIPFEDANDFLIESVKLRGGNLGVQSVVYVKNNHGKIMLGICHEATDSEKYLQIIKQILNS